MSLRKRHLAAITAGAAAISLGMTGGAVTASAAVSPATTRLADSAAPFTATTKATAAAPAAQRVSFQLWLRPNVQAAEAYATAVSTPGNALYHHFLSPTAYTARFAASTSSAHAVESWLKSQGFSVTTSLHGSRQRAYVRATGTVTQVNAAFKTTMALYPSTAEVSAGKAGLETNSKPLAVPSSIAGDLSAVSGLDNVAAVLTLATDNGKVHDPVAGTQSMAANAVSGQQCSTYYGQVVTQDLPTHFGSTAFPTEGCGYSATQLRKAYDVTTATKGGGVTIALVELGLASHMYETLQDYATANNLASPSSTRYFETSLGDDTCGDPFDGEEQLDVESAYALAPSSTEVVIGGDSCNFGDGGLQGLLDADQYVVTGTNGHPVADIASNSWEASNEGGVPTAYTQIMHDFLVQAATEGVTMLFSSGDNSGVEEPSDDPYATAVGGTTLGISQTNSRLFETGWSTGGSGSRTAAGPLSANWAPTAADRARSGPSPPTRRGSSAPTATRSSGTSDRCARFPTSVRTRIPTPGFSSERSIRPRETTSRVTSVGRASPRRWPPA